MRCGRIVCGSSPSTSVTLLESGHHMLNHESIHWIQLDSRTDAKSFAARRSQYDASRNLADGFPDATRQLAIVAPELRSIVLRFLLPSLRARYHCRIAVSFVEQSKKRQPTESFRRVLVRCPPWLALSLAVCCSLSSRCASETSIALRLADPAISARGPRAPACPRFYTDTSNAGDQSDHRVCSVTGRQLNTLQASVLDLADLITDEPPALHVAMQLS